MFYAATARGEAVVFANQGDNRDMMVACVWEAGREPLELRVPSGSYEAVWLEHALADMAMAA